jgi:flagellar protein FlaG
VTELKYVYFDKLQTYYVQVQDVNTHQVIREIPPKKFLEMYASVAEKLGLIVNDKA